MNLDGSHTAEIAAALVSARRARRPLDGFPGPLPGTMDEAYLIQDMAIAAWGSAVAGWKVAMIAPELRAPLGAERLAGPVFTDNVQDATRGPVEIAAIRGGFAAIEAEFVVTIARDITDAAAIADDGLLPYVAEVHCGAEFAGSAISDINGLGPRAIASDLGNNAGVIVGPPVRSWRDDLDDIATAVRINDAPVGAGSGASVPGGPFAAVRFLAAHLLARGRCLRAGDLVSTGATTGIHTLSASDRIDIDFAGETVVRAVVRAA
jgi:2-keto-4-pentenoate hydratase